MTRRYYPRRAARPLYRTAADALVFLAVLTATLYALREFGVIDLGSGNAQVIDGDSLRRGDLDIRLHGIDAPEYRQTCRDKHDSEYPCGKQAANALRGLVGKQEVSCRSIETDRYGRAVAVCRIGGLEINGEMVRLGWAIAYRRHGLQYVNAETAAKKSRRGIWQGHFDRPEDWRARHRNSAVQSGMADAPFD